MKIATAVVKKAGYETGKSIVDDVTFEVHEGEQIGVIGPNGAGKSTSIKAMIGLLKAKEGAIYWEDGHSRYAYVPEQPIYYKELTFYEHITVACSSFELDEKKTRESAERYIEQFEMSEVKHHYVESFSKGMQQKAMIIIALTIRPNLYIFDEPFIGLDPRATRVLLEILQEERQRGAGVIMSTHVLDTAERVCDRFILIHKGSVLAHGDLTVIQETANLPEATLFDCFDALTRTNPHDA
ncbi:ABC transporter ATP-binding protein [Geomicrobium sediminis]|uniref:ABC-2 type transport system ATP-binding protein n=1 Tax=Geomicrobium sediminis TaxID=1347788 RepID=A0ABS2PE40_9BACL|nr:ABC transporter ATP-binding protein [Geomicrobium sediminis]MBM7633246.1 ABC-2 type transport system ATP-binding protein [Geomicrobium sediminis]